MFAGSKLQLTGCYPCDIVREEAMPALGCAWACNRDTLQREFIDDETHCEGL